MRVALVHDYIKEYGGAERVLEALHEIWPSAPVFTTVYLPSFLGPHKERFKDWNIKTSFLQHFPFKAKLISPFRLIMPLAFKSFDFSDFDIVIVSATGAYSPNVIKISNFKLQIPNKSQNTKSQNYMLYAKRYSPVQICYCHTPPRYLYSFATAREWKNNLIFRVLGELANHFLRIVDFKSSQNVDFFIANSKNVAKRIKKFYRRNSIVIYPPVEIPNPKLQIPNKSQNTKYYLTGGRIARPKHVELIIKTFGKLKLPLKIFGRSFGGLELSELRIRNRKSRIEFLGEVTDEEKLELMRNAKAYIFASEDEDFGITPVETMSVGTPVIAYRSGGVKESIVDGRTGLFFDELSVKSLSKAIEQFNNLTINPEDCIKQAKKFSKERFKKEIKEFVKKATKYK